MTDPESYDVVIVGAGVSGALIAKRLGLAGKKVLVLEAGDSLSSNSRNFMNRFYSSIAKVPESPYTPDVFESHHSPSLANVSKLNAGRPTSMSLEKANWKDPDQSYLVQCGPLAFGSTYERIAGGTMRHWLGTSLRFVPNDFRMKAIYGKFVDWPISYEDLNEWYGKAEHEIGVSAEKSEQSYLGIQFPAAYEYPMPAIPPSLVDRAVRNSVAGKCFEAIPLAVASTPAGRNSQPYQGRRVCAGNTNCIPICPIQAKYDPSVTLNDAIATRRVEIRPKTVATGIVLGENGRVNEIEYVTYEDPAGSARKAGRVSATVFVIAANAIETPRLLLMSTNRGRTPEGVANRSGQVGKNLMDHPLYLAWALAPEAVYGYRGPLSTSGIETLRDGEFRRDRAAFRVEIGNEGWNFSINDPYTTTLDFINGRNDGGLNRPDKGPPKALFGEDLVKTLNRVFTRQFRLGFLVEQSPDESNCIQLSKTIQDNLGLPRPEVHYDFSDYTKKGLAAARKAANEIFGMMGAKPFTTDPEQGDPTAFKVVGEGGKQTELKFYGAGHIVGTYRMGSNCSDSVVDRDQRSWQHKNLFLVGSGTFPTVATANPTLTIAALALRTAESIARDLA